jgi:hypothetical protein
MVLGSNSTGFEAQESDNLRATHVYVYPVVTLMLRITKHHNTKQMMLGVTISKLSYKNESRIIIYAAASG